ncbi:MAG TPA: DUF1501 domain-containing protein [Pirellulales bacterium]|jgi:uncharacterized protein (DUF1501 family)|nr:DUF1501 domain-containing protein [Pirellulales bacterium]
MSIQLCHCITAKAHKEGAFGRRDFLKGISASAIAGGLAGGLLHWTDLVTANAADLRSRGMACILLWMQGGPSQFETFSPKPGTATGGETKAISTAVPGIQIASDFPEVAKQAGDIAFIRSVNSREGAHPRAQLLMHTGYLPLATVKYPTLGSLVAHEIADAAGQLPSFVRIGGGRASGGGGGFLGNEFDPFDIPNPSAPPTNTTVQTDMGRYNNRLDLLGQLEIAAGGGKLSSESADHQKLYQRAVKMITSPDMRAFDLTKENDKTRAAYGDSAFGNGCLLARRLVEAGVTFVEVQLDGWDTHQDNFARVSRLADTVDKPFAALVADLKQRGLLDKTLVIWMGEFGRTPNINANSGRDHFPKAFNVALAGAGIRGGRVIGETDATGQEIKERPVAVNDLFQTFCKSLGMKPEHENMSSIGRPIKVVDGGKPVHELFS